MGSGEWHTTVVAWWNSRVSPLRALSQPKPINRSDPHRNNGNFSCWHGTKWYNVDVLYSALLLSALQQSFWSVSAYAFLVLHHPLLTVCLLQMKKMHPIDPEKACPFVGQTLKELRSVVGNEATVLGFVGCPYTLATYMVEVGCAEVFLSRPADFMGLRVSVLSRVALPPLGC